MHGRDFSASQDEVAFFPWYTVAATLFSGGFVEFDHILSSRRGPHQRSSCLCRLHASVPLSLDLILGFVERGERCWMKELTTKNMAVRGDVGWVYLVCFGRFLGCSCDQAGANPLL